MSPIPPPHPDCARLIAIAASIARGLLLPPEKAMNEFERLKLQSANQNIAVEIRRASDSLRDRIHALEQQLATAGQAAQEAT